ncbi:MAG: HAMP domain-containing histidine kinase [Archangiaceae bacterium]|nr:HAMP domain-containing histidine kinase [Archangiaceae bacterium]
MISWEESALAEQSARAFAFASRVRAFAVLVFVPLVGWHTAQGDEGWEPYLKPLVPYALFALAIFQLRFRQWVHQVGAFSFLVDVLFVFAMQMLALPTSPFPAGVAGFSLGLFSLLVLLAGSSMHRDATLATALFAAPLQVALMRQAGVGLGAQLSAVVVLGAAALAQAGFVRRLVTMVRSAASLEVAHRLETERVQKLEDARATIATLYEEAEARNRQLSTLQTEKDVLTSLLVHDLRAPLSAVKANLDWLKGEVGALNDEDVTQAVAESRQVTDRLTGMIGDLLNISKLEAKALPLQAGPVLARTMLQSLGKQLAAQARSRQVTVTVEAEDFTFDGDQSLLLRTLENLSSNALRYTPPSGRVQLEARAGGGEVLLFVRNDGNPIPPHVRPTLFDKFVQGGDAKENRRVGWGLGLYFCKLCVDAHGGSISVEDAPGWPTSFVVRLPRLVVTAARAA